MERSGTEVSWCASNVEDLGGGLASTNIRVAPIKFPTVQVIDAIIKGKFSLMLDHC